LSRAQENATEALAILARVRAKLRGEPLCLAGGVCDSTPTEPPAGTVPAPGVRWVKCARCMVAREVRS
jgi:hypothetical protein